MNTINDYYRVTNVREQAERRRAEQDTVQSYPYYTPGKKQAALKPANRHSFSSGGSYNLKSHKELLSDSSSHNNSARASLSNSRRLYASQIKFDDFGVEAAADKRAGRSLYQRLTQSLSNPAIEEYVRTPKQHKSTKQLMDAISDDAKQFQPYYSVKYNTHKKDMERMGLRERKDKNQHPIFIFNDLEYQRTHMEPFK